jgi:hypothetical protein
MLLCSTLAPPPSKPQKPLKYLTLLHRHLALQGAIHGAIHGAILEAILGDILGATMKNLITTFLS